MDSDVKQSVDVFQLAAWVHANRKRLIAIAVAAAVVGLSIGIYIWHGNQREESANEALAAVKPAIRAPGLPMTPPPADAYLKVANEYPSTAAGARALLVGATAQFDAGNFKEAEATFQRFLQDYPDYPLSSQAQIGVAASLEAQGKTAEAATHYKEFRERHASDSAMPQATSALARLYEAQGKPDQALKLYEELASKRNNDTWSQEAPIQVQELLTKHPELKPKPAPAPEATVPAVKSLIQSAIAAGSTSAPPRGATSAPVMIPAPATPKPGSGIPLMITNKP